MPLNRLPKLARHSLMGGAALLLALPAVGGPVTASAQETADDDGDVIIVSARRRDESLQDVPLSVSAISGEDLAARGTIDITEVAQLVPNTTLEVSRGTNTTLTAFIRGVGQQDPVAGFEAGVGLYIDDVYLNRPQGAVLDIYDVERIEVLRGPQGTLYGRNTIGGAVKYVTKRLGDEPSLRVRGTYGSYNQRDVIITGELPISDVFRVGGSVASLNRDGFGDNLTTGEENYNKEILGFRASAEYQPTEELFFRLSADYVEDTSNAKGGHREIPSLWTGVVVGDEQFEVLDDVFDTRAGIEGPNEVEQSGISLVAEWDIAPELMLKSITAFRQDDTISQIDFDALPSEDVDVPVIYENEQFTQEFQAIYTGENTNWVGGIFYIDANAFDTFDVILDDTGQILSPPLPGLNANTTGDVDTVSWSIFADITYDLGGLVGLEGWELGIGGRYTEDERTAFVFRETYIGGRTDALGGEGAIGFGPDTDFTGTETWTDFSPRVSLAYSPNSDHNLYVSYSQGFKGGGFDPRGLATAAIDLDQDGDVDEEDVFNLFLFEPEEVDSYEVGWKATLFNGRLNSSIAYFYADYTDIQIPGSAGVEDPNTGATTFVGITTNAGAATIQGLELEGVFDVAEDLFTAGDNFTVAYSLGLIDAEYDEFIVEGENVADDRVVQNTPESTGSLQTTYMTPVGAGTLSFLTTTSFKGDTNQFEVPNELLDQDAYALFDASLVWAPDNGRYTLSLHGKNLFDEEYRVAGYNFLAQNDDGSFVEPLTSTLGLEGIATSFYGNPRQIFATIDVNF